MSKMLDNILLDIKPELKEMGSFKGKSIINDMKLDSLELVQLMTMIEEKLKLDRTKTQVEGFTKLDLMELTRKHICSHKE